MLLEDNGLLPFLEDWRFFAEPKIQSNTAVVFSPILFSTVSTYTLIFNPYIHYICNCTNYPHKYQARLPAAVREMSPRSSPEQPAERMGLLLSITTKQIATCSNRAGRINLFSWSRFQTADVKVLFDVACDRVLEHFKLKNLNHSERKVLAKRGWQMVGMFSKFNQPELDQ